MCAAERPQSLSATRSRRPRTRYYYYGRLFLETWSISNTAQNCRRNSSADDSRVMQCTSSYGGASASSNTPKLFQDNAHRHARSHGMRYAIQRTRETEKKSRDQCVVIISIITKPCASALCAFWPDVATQCDAGVRRVKPSRAQHSPPCCQPAHVLAMRLFLEQAHASEMSALSPTAASAARANCAHAKRLSAIN